MGRLLVLGVAVTSVLVWILSYVILAGARDVTVGGSGGATGGSDEILGTLQIRAFDLGFEPATVDVAEPGRYAITFVNDGAVLHDLTFDDGTVIQAEAGQTVVGEVVIPDGGMTFVCSVPGHTDAGMTGSVTVAGAGGTENGGHPWNGEAMTMRVEDRDNPINAAFAGRDFEIADQAFQLQEPVLRDRLHVLLSIDPERSTRTARKVLPVRMKDMDFPMSWIRRQGQGRVFYLGLGHSAPVFWHPALLQHLLAGIQYALGDLDADDRPDASRGGGAPIQLQR